MNKSPLPTLAALAPSLTPSDDRMVTAPLFALRGATPQRDSEVMGATVTIGRREVPWDEVTAELRALCGGRTDDDARLFEAVVLALCGLSLAPSSVVVSVHEGVVQLTGVVRSAAERDAIERVARAAPGTRALTSELTLGD
jgi:osmotically-inducible protein OsmY